MIQHHATGHASPAHHPPAEYLMDYATGALAEARAMAIAAHVDLCPHCREEVARFEAIGGAMIGAEAPAEEGDDGSLRRALQQIDRPADRPGRGAAPGQADDATRHLLPSSLWPYVGGNVGALAWRTVGLGVREAKLPVTGKGHRVSLLRIAAGRGIARHTHGGDEFTLVLAGGFTDRGAHYGRGDFALADPGLEHRPVADAGEDCICLAVIDAPMRFTGFFGRLISPFLKTA